MVFAIGAIVIALLIGAGVKWALDNIGLLKKKTDNTESED